MPRDLLSPAPVKASRRSQIGHLVTSPRREPDRELRIRRWGLVPPAVAGQLIHPEELPQLGSVPARVFAVALPSYPGSALCRHDATYRPEGTGSSQRGRLVCPAGQALASSCSSPARGDPEDLRHLPPRASKFGPPGPAVPDHLPLSAPPGPRRRRPRPDSEYLPASLLGAAMVSYPAAIAAWALSGNVVSESAEHR
jgi:hypothetical protein